MRTGDRKYNDLSYARGERTVGVIRNPGFRGYYSSYEKKPLGRTEWVKLYGLLSGKEEEATAAFDREKEEFEQISQDKATGKTVAFFYITSNGEVNVRKASDYLPKV